MVGAVLVKHGKIIGTGWHHAAGQPHAEIEAIHDARRRGKRTKGASLYVTLEPCCTFGRTPPCTEAIIAAQITRVIAGCSDPNPQHCGKGFTILRRAGIEVSTNALGKECETLNEAFNHWILHRMPLVTLKAAMTLDGKIATASGESKWITSTLARAHGMKLRQGADAILVGINTILADDPSLTIRNVKKETEHTLRSASLTFRQPRRIILDTMARTPLRAKVLNNEGLQTTTTIVVSKKAPKSRIAALEKRGARVLVVPTDVRARGLHASLDLWSLLKVLGDENVTSLLVEGGGEVNASFLRQRLAQRIAFFYAPKVLGGRHSIPGVGGIGAENLNTALRLADVRWRKLGPDLLLTARVLTNPK
jgi:diaminohydroxyphosphoribosylaminopyrimidine deaminase/5-amino-6-(5-phosphoribosylamino)uracil reductase